MSVEILCPDCEFAYVLDEAPDGGAFTCPSCSRVLTVPAPGPARQVATPSGFAEVAAGTAELTAAVEPASAAARRSGTPPATRTEIVCPRCKLHFAAEKHTVELHPGDRPRVLLVEEAGYSRDATAEALERDYDVVTAGTVDAAARILSLGGIDLMVLDTDIDQGFGRRLLRSGAAKVCPIVIYGHDESECYGEAWDALRQEGADDIVIKGMNAAETLSRKVPVLLGRTPDPELA